MSTVRWGSFLLLIAFVAPSCGGNNAPPKPPPVLAIAPSNLVATATTTSRINLIWTDNSDNEVQFRIERSEDLGVTYSQIAAVGPDTTAFGDLGLLAGRTYYYRVTAWNGAGSTAFAGPSNATTKSLIWKTTIGGPGIRADHSAIYDSLGKRMILFGGVDDFFSFYNDVWALDLNPSTNTLATPTNFWSILTPTPTGTPPTPRRGHSAVYDVQNNRMIIFAGEDDTPAPGNPFKNDVHILNLGSNPSWSTATVSGTAPTARSGHAAVYDAANQRMVVFGGANSLGKEQGDTFFLSLPSGNSFNWSPGPFGPIQRTEHSAIYDGFRQQMVIFGGLDHYPFPDGSELNQDTWHLSLSGAPSWTAGAFLGTPQFRQGHTAVYDAGNQRMVIFGGDTTFVPTPTSNLDLWSLRFDVAPSWVFLSPTTGPVPSARYGHSAVYDSGAQRMIIYGGYDDSTFPTFPTVGPPDPNTWIIDF